MNIHSESWQVYGLRSREPIINCHTFYTKKQIYLAFNIITLFSTLLSFAVHFTAFFLKEEMCDYRFLADGRRRKKEDANIFNNSLNNDFRCWGKSLGHIWHLAPDCSATVLCPRVDLTKEFCSQNWRQLFAKQQCQS